ncbi:MAG: hypothetical protein SF182_05770 [Deltaproteobacteria bacterium]|nr:hypothetical protein [Deltaproteobacteria bacterium]
MPGMPDIILKSPVMGRFETFTKGVANSAAKQAKLQTAIARLANPADSLVQIAVDLKFYSDKAAADHFERHWLGVGMNPTPFWPSIPSAKITAIIRGGMLQVCQLVDDTWLPAEFWWVMSGQPGTGDWQMSVSKGANQITAIFHTPVVPCGNIPLEEAPNTWVVLDEAGVKTRHAMRPVPPAAKKKPKKPPKKKKKSSRR